MFTKLDIEKYFSAIKNESILLMVLGIAAMIASVVCLIWIKSAIYKGAAIPLVVFGLLMLVSNFATYRQCDELRKRNVYAFDLNPSELKMKELPRMEAVLKALRIGRYGSLALLLAGIAIWMYCRAAPERSIGNGVGMSMVVLVMVYLSANAVHSQRSKQYLQGLQHYISKHPA